jgi:hypothetical protein
VEDFERMSARAQEARVKGIVQRVKADMPKTKHKSKSYNPTIVTAFFKEHGIPAPEFEYQFHPTRKWRFDLAWEIYNKPVKVYGFDSSEVMYVKVAVEAQGGIFRQGRHCRGTAMLKEWEKLNEAAAMGWRILYVQPCDLCTTEFAQTIKRALGI